jgi:hypothetical protein
MTWGGRNYVGRQSGLRITRHSGGLGRTNVVRVYFTPIDESGARYVIHLGPGAVTQEIRSQRKQARKAVTP